jgi:hypothetical protein
MISFFNGPPFPPCHRDYASEQRYIEKSRSRTVGERWRFTCALTEIDMLLIRSEIRNANPTASEDELKVLFVAKVYGEELAERFGKYLAEKRNKR